MPTIQDTTAGDNAAIIAPSVILPLLIVGALSILLTIAGCYRKLRRFDNLKHIIHNLFGSVLAQ